MSLLMVGCRGAEPRWTSILYSLVLQPISRLAVLRDMGLSEGLGRMGGGRSRISWMRVLERRPRMVCGLALRSGLRTGSLAAALSEIIASGG